MDQGAKKSKPKIKIAKSRKKAKALFEVLSLK